MSETKEMTLGEKRVHLNFNPSSDDKIGTFKRMMADAIDYCNAEILNNNSTENRDRQDAENKGEACRCFATAMFHLETAQMYGVKGIAKTLNQ